MNNVAHDFHKPELAPEPFPMRAIRELNKIADDHVAYEVGEVSGVRGEIERRYHDALTKIVGLSITDFHQDLKRALETADQRLGHSASNPLFFRALAHIEQEQRRVEMGAGRDSSAGC